MEQGIFYKVSQTEYRDKYIGKNLIQNNA